jgi:hypothetical protein
MLRNEARHVAEWVAFHHSVGYNRIVNYDDNSTDGLAQTLAKLRDSWYALRKVDWPYKLKSRHSVSEAQRGVISRCVDEFMFPCKGHWSGADMWQAALEYTSWFIHTYTRHRTETLCPEVPPPFASNVACLNFGYSGNVHATNSGVIDTYVRRAWYDDDPVVVDGVELGDARREDNGSTWNVLAQAKYGSRATWMQCQAMPTRACLGAHSTDTRTQCATTRLGKTFSPL